MFHSFLVMQALDTVARDVARADMHRVDVRALELRAQGLHEIMKHDVLLAHRCAVPRDVERITLCTSGDATSIVIGEPPRGLVSSWRHNGPLY